MRFLLFLPLVMLLGYCEQSNPKPLTGTAITGCDGITVIKAYQSKPSNTVMVDIIMRPEMRKSIYVLWSSIDSNQKRRIHKSRVTEGVGVSTLIKVSPGAEIIDIHIMGYERIGT